MKILIYGSTYISAIVTKHLLDRGFDLVGHVPSVSAIFPHEMPIPSVEETVAHDIRISLQYDKKIKNLDKNSYNLHTGLLPDYGGCSILYETVKDKAKEQGLTFHRMTEKFDKGEIVSKVTYPVLSTDTVVDLYAKMVQIAPPFMEMCLSLLDWEGNIQEPTIHYRSVVPPEVSERDVAAIRSYISEHSLKF